MVAEREIPASTGDFRLMDRTVVEALKALPERNRFMKGLFAWVGFRQVGVPYVRPPRAAGETSFPYRRLFRFALDGMTSFSTAPLRVWTLVGVGSAIVALLAAVGIVWDVREPTERGLAAKLIETNEPVSREPEAGEERSPAPRG